MNLAPPAARFFLSNQDIVNIVPFGTGNINDTYLVTLGTGEQMVLQRISPAVFPDPTLVQHNMRLVVHHLDRAIQNAPDLKKQFIPLMLFRGREGDTFVDDGGAAWRLTNRIPGNIYDSITSPLHAQEIGRCLGLFHRLLSTFKMDSLGDALPGFHDTAAYLYQYDSACANTDNRHRLDVEYCHNFIAAHRSLATLLAQNQELSCRVIHGDPKVSNFVFDENTEQVISLIDLDTVRSGLLLHDIGDCLRSCCNPLGESPPEPEQVRFDQDLFSEWLKGYMGEAELLLTNADKAHIVQAVQVISFELGLRFFTDYLTGNHYFKTSYPEQNVFRARVQFQLLQSIEQQQEDLEMIVGSQS